MSARSLSNKVLLDHLGSLSNKVLSDHLDGEAAVLVAEGESVHQVAGGPRAAQRVENGLEVLPLFRLVVDRLLTGRCVRRQPKRKKPTDSEEEAEFEAEQDRIHGPAGPCG